MKSKRTISYLGLWALIIPWLGFSWNTKSILFSITGIILLIIGNRQYHNEKRKQKNDHPKPEQNNFTFTTQSPEIKIDPIPTFSTPEIKIDSTPIESNMIHTEFTAPNNQPISKPRTTRRRVEMAPRTKKIAVKSENYITQNNNENYDPQ